MLNKNTLLKIKIQALKIDHDVAFGGKSKGNRHLWRVVKLAKYMAKQLGANVSVVEAGAWLHDTALPSGNDYDYKKNKEIVKVILTTFNLSVEDSDMIAECVASHEGTSKPKSLEAKIVHDADVLEKSGVLGVIRHTWKLTNSGKLTADNTTKRDATKILNHLRWRSKKLQTSLGKKIHSYLSVPISVAQAEKIIFIVAEKALNGIVTEKIASSIYKKLTVKQEEKLKEQLNQAYLDKF
ncbi:MAG: HD domain-containing protein [bacterium]|nr:HD domain-containing protein [bacterium]